MNDFRARGIPCLRPTVRDSSAMRARARNDGGRPGELKSGTRVLTSRAPRGPVARPRGGSRVRRNPREECEEAPTRRSPCATIPAAPLAGTCEGSIAAACVRVPLYTGGQNANRAPVTVLAGGGSSGVVFARLIERGAAPGIRALEFDFRATTAAARRGTPRCMRAQHPARGARIRRACRSARRGVAHGHPARRALAGVLDAAAVSGELRRRARDSPARTGAGSQ